MPLLRGGIVQRGTATDRAANDRKPPKPGTVYVAAQSQHSHAPNRGAPAPPPAKRTMMVAGVPSTRDISLEVPQVDFGFFSTIETPMLYRFNAYADLHLDAYENPAYAAAATSGETRASLYGTAPQLSVIQPLGKGFVGGGTVAAARSRTGCTNAAALDCLNVFSSFSAFTARRVGSTSVGVSVERLRLGTAISSSILMPGGFSELTASQTRVTAGTTTRISNNADFTAGTLARSPFTSTHFAVQRDIRSTCSLVPPT